ncbi:MAG TPA: sigma-70 family RNA polymerase sigma factor, partial [Gemmataceae bacterium]|nr:sigma-70 family RNA polymerase sigma factor [Gemmataceae bacterium]
MFPLAHHKPLLTESEIEAIRILNVQTYLHQRLQARVPDTVLAESWDEFYDWYSAVLPRFARSCGVPKDEVENLVQSVWAIAIVRLRTLDWNSNRAGLRAWFATLVQRRAIDFMRERNRRPTTSLPEGDVEPITDPNAGAAEHLDQQWERELLHTALANLRPKVGEQNYRILEMHYFEGRPMPEIAKTLGLTEQSVRGRQKRMLQRLRKLVAFYSGEDPKSV